MSSTSLERRVGDLERRLANLVRVGTIAQADYAKALVRVRCDDYQSGWLPWATRRAGGDVDWWAPEVGEQVMVVAPSGVLEHGFVVPALYSDAHAEPAASPDVHTVRYAGGDYITHDRAAGKWHLHVSGDVVIEAGGSALVQTPSATIDAPQTHATGNVTVDGMLTVAGGMAISGGSESTATITGDVQVNGNINATGSIMDAGGNSNHHTH